MSRTGNSSLGKDLLFLAGAERGAFVVGGFDDSSRPGPLRILRKEEGWGDCQVEKTCRGVFSGEPDLNNIVSEEGVLRNE